MPSLPVLRAPLSDGVISLRPVAERDIPETLIAFQDDPRLEVRLGMDRPPSAAELGREAERALAQWEAGVGARLAITAAGEDTLQGEINVHHLVWEHARGELGIWLAPGARGRGWAARALRLAGDWLFEEAGLARIELRTDVDNAPMLAAAASAGFAREGVLRGYTLERGARVDNVFLARLRS